MSFYLSQGGSTLYHMTQAGAATSISLPSGITLFGSSTPCRFAVLGNYIVVVNGATADFVIGLDLTTYPLIVPAPATAPVLATIAGGGLTGVYQVRQTNRIHDKNGVLVIESAPSAAANITTSGQGIAVESFEVSPNAQVNRRELHRTLANGSAFYNAGIADDNTRTSWHGAAGTAKVINPLLEANDTTLAAASTLAEDVQNPPLLKCVVAWDDKLFGVPRMNFDEVWWSQDRSFYNWPVVNSISIPVKKTDQFGVVGFAPRRDALGIGRRDSFHMLTASGDSYQRRKISDIGLVSQESVVVVRDVAYFLGIQNGRYVICEWDDNGVKPVSEMQVDDWFNSSTYLNSTYFTSCQGRYNPDTDAVEFLFAAAGSSVLDRYVSYHIRERVWYGLHKSAEFTFSCAGTDNQRGGTLTNSSNGKIAVWGGTDGRLYKRDSTVKNDNASAVAMDVDTPFFQGNDPDRTQHWDRITVLNRVQASGVLAVTPKIGDTQAAAKLPTYVDLTRDRTVLGRLGEGRLTQLNLQHNTAGEGCGVYGIVLPVEERGRR